MIEIRDLEKSFGTERVLKSINISIDKGDIFGLVGRSGVGKTTLLECINGLQRYDSGLLVVNGQDVGSLYGEELRKFRSRTGMIFQQFSLLERSTVYENIALPLKCWKYPKKDIPNRVNELLDLVSLQDKKDQKPRNLSGGQKQRVAIARALALDSTLLLCDEATSALDPNTTQSVLALLKKINAELGVTIVVVTHEMSVVRAICNKVAILDKDGIADQGNVEDVFMRQCPALLELLGTGESIELSDQGRTIRICYSSNTSDMSLLSRMAQETGVAFDMVEGGIEQYRSGTLGEFTIHFNDDDMDIMSKYLTENDIVWEILK